MTNVVRLPEACRVQFDCKGPESVRSWSHVACRLLLEALCLPEACPYVALFVRALPTEFGCRGALLLDLIAGGLAESGGLLEVA